MKKHLLATAVCIFLLSATAFSQSVVKHILLEEFSTAPCGFCPDGDLVAQQLIIDHPAVIWLTHHAGFGTDSMTVPESITIANAFTQFAPGATIDRGDYPIPVYTMPPYIAISRQKWDSVCVAHLNDPPVVDVIITNNYDSVSRLLNCTVDATFLTQPAVGDLRLNLFLVEDSVVGFGPGYDQTNYYNTTVGHPYYGAGDPIVGYVHHHVLRKVATGTWGLTGVIPNSPVIGTTYSHSFTNIPIPAAWKEDDMDVIAFVSYYNASASLRQVINSSYKILKDYSITTGITETNAQPDNISVFPNPASDRIYLYCDLESENKNKLVITDLSGKEIRSFELNKNTKNFIFNIEDLQNGIYLYEIISNKAITGNGKLAVIH